MLVPEGEKLAAGSLLQSLLTQHPQAECWLGRTKLLAWSVMEAKLTSRSLERSFYQTYQTLNRTDRFTMIQGQNGDVLAICWFSSRTLPAESLPVRCSWCTLLSMVWTFKKAFSRPGSSYCTQASTVTRWHHASYLQGTSSPEEMWRMVKSWDPTEVWQCMSQWAIWMYWKLAQHQSLDTCSPAKGPWWSMQLMVFFSFVSLHLLDIFLAFKSQPSRRARQLWVLDTALRCAPPPAAVLDHRSYTRHAVVWTKLLRLQGHNKE